MNPIVLEGISPEDKPTLMRWWALLNAKEWPEDFPARLKTGEDTKEAWRAVGDLLTWAECSLGWWVFKLGREPDEWRTWWLNNSQANRGREVEATFAIAALATPPAAQAHGL